MRRFARICVGAEPGFVWASFSLVAVVQELTYEGWRDAEEPDLVRYGWFSLN